MDPDDLPGYLVDAIETAVKDGLAHLSLSRVGTSKTMWQASSRMSGDNAFRVDIRDDPFDALFGVLGPRRVPSTPPAAAAADMDIFG